MRKLILATSLLLPATSYAGGYNIPNEIARDLALSSATTASQTGPEALFINEAELAGQDGLAIAASGEILVNRTTWSDEGQSASLIPQYNTPPSGTIGFGKHLNKDMALGLAVGVDLPAGGALVWPNGWQGQEYIQTVDQKVFRIGAGVGFQPIPAIINKTTNNRYRAAGGRRRARGGRGRGGGGGGGRAGGAGAGAGG